MSFNLLNDLAKVFQGPVSMWSIPFSFYGARLYADGQLMIEENFKTIKLNIHDIKSVSLKCEGLTKAKVIISENDTTLKSTKKLPYNEAINLKEWIEQQKDIMSA